jgi:mannosyltransferase OCH1-like enzyme
MPEKYEYYEQAWKRLNPDWEVQTWTSESVEAVIFQNQAVIDDVLNRDGGRNGVECFVQLADIMGYELVHQFGGVYTNVDIEPVKSLAALGDAFDIWPETDWSTWEDQHLFVANCIFGGPKNSAFWKYVIDSLPASYHNRPGEEMNQVTGPVFLTACINGWIASGRIPPKILPERAFNPVHWKSIPLGGDADAVQHDLDGVFGVHHWGHKLTGRTNYVESATQPGNPFRQ